jgi:hypothetical protein
MWNKLQDNPPNEEYKYLIEGQGTPVIVITEESGYRQVYLAIFQQNKFYDDESLFEISRDKIEYWCYPPGK